PEAWSAESVDAGAGSDDEQPARRRVAAIAAAASAGIERMSPLREMGETLHSLAQRPWAKLVTAWEPARRARAVEPTGCVRPRHRVRASPLSTGSGCR